MIYNTFLDATLCIQTKNRKQKRNTRLYDMNRKKCKTTLQAQKKKINNQNQNSLRFSLRKFIVSVSFLYFYNFLFAFIHYTFCFNSINMGFCWIFRSFNSIRLADSLFKVSCNFSSTTFSDFNSLISFVRASPFLVLASEASFSFLSARNLQ